MSRSEQISRRLKLRQLSIMLAVAEWGSMAKAAKHLAITQSVISKAVADLESTIGVRLLDRGAHGVEPTIFGRALLRHSIAVFDDLRSGVSEIEFLSDATAGELRIGAMESLCAGLLPTLIDDLTPQYPRLSFNVVQADATTLKDRELRTRKIEMAIMRTTATDREKDFEKTPLYSDRLCVVAGADSSWATRRKVKLADLVNERWCLPPPDHPVGLLINSAFRRRGLDTPRSSATATTPQFVTNLVAKGRHLGVHGTSYLRFNPSAAALKVLPIDLQIPASSISILTLKDRTLSPVAQLFIDHAVEATRSLRS